MVQKISPCFIESKSITYMLTTQICQTTGRDVQSVIEMTFLAAQCMYDYFLLRANNTLFYSLFEFFL